MQRVNKLFHSIRFRVMVTILFINTLIFGFLSYYSSVQLSELPPLTFNRYQEIVDARAREFSNELDGLANQIEMLSYSPIIKSMDLDIIQPYLVSLLQQERFLILPFLIKMELPGQHTAVLLISLYNNNTKRLYSTITLTVYLILLKAPTFPMMSLLSPLRIRLSKTMLLLELLMVS